MTTKLDLQELDVRIVRKRYYRDGYGVYEVELIDDGEERRNGRSYFYGHATQTTVIVGNFDREFFPLEEYIMYGRKSYNQKYKQEQWEIVSVRSKFNSIGAIKRFLLSLTSSEKIVDQLIAKYGKDVIDKIEKNEVDYSDINGLGPVLYEKIRGKVLENLYMKDIIAELSQYDVTLNQMRQIVNKFGASAIQKIHENPYNLCKIRGIGFRKADVIASKMGFEKNFPPRIREGIKYILQENEANGHTWIDRAELLKQAKELLDVDMREVDDILKQMDGDDIIIVDDHKVGFTRTYEAEFYIASRLIELQKKCVKLDVDVDAYVKQLKEQHPTITDEQLSLFYNFAQNTVNFLIGYAGTGKTWVTNLLLKMVKDKHTVLLLAPTGKAAKVLEEYTGLKASTIHRAIGIYASEDDEDDDGIAKYEPYQEIIVVDEISMADVKTLAKLLEACRNIKRILFIGDDFQIPSVGAGNFLYDVKNSNLFKITRLTKVFRQEEGGILDIATKVRENVRFMDNNFKLNLPLGHANLRFGNDAIIHPVSQEYMLKGVLTYYKQALKEGYSPEDIIVLTPTKVGNLGTKVLNKLIQDIVNPEDPDKKQIVYGKDPATAPVYRVGDRVINIKNNYHALNVFDEETTVYNGDMGVIVDIDLENGYLIIDYGFDEIKTSVKNLDTISHAYAMTIHKSQGSGFKVVILVTDKSHKFMLNANLVYTGITRTKERLIWLCQPDVINYSMSKIMPETRNCFLPGLLSLVAGT